MSRGVADSASAAAYDDAAPLHDEAAASYGPFVFTLTGGGTTLERFTGHGAGPCDDFTVGPITANTTFTGTGQDAERRLREGLGHGNGHDDAASR